MLGRPAELLADQREQAVDRVGLGVTLGGAAGPGGRPGRLAGSHVRSARAWGRPRIVARRCGVAGRLARAGGEASRGPVRLPVVIRRSSVGLGLVVIVGARGPVVGGGRVRAGRRERPGGQPAKLPGPIEPDQDLAEQPLVARRLAPGAQRLDRDLGHGPRGVGGGERPPVEPLGRREQAGRRDEVRVAGAPGHRLEADVGAGARSGREDAPGRQQLDDRRRVLVGVGQPRGEQPVAGRRSAHHGRDDRLGTAVDQLDDPAVAGHDRLDRLERPADRGSLPAPRRPERGPGEGVDREQQRGLAAERPRRGVVGAGQAVEAQAHRRLAEHQADLGRRARPAVAGRLVAERQQAARAGEAEDGRRRSLAQAAQVLAEPRLDRSGRSALEPLDEAADLAEGVLEGEPRVALAELGAALRPDVPGRHPQGSRPAGLGGEPAGRQDGMDEGQAEGGQHGRSAQVALDPLEDRAEADELARGMQVEQLVGQVVRPVDVRKPATQRLAHRLEPDVGRDPAQVVGVERRLTLLRATALVATDGAAVVLGHGRVRPATPASSSTAHRTSSATRVRPQVAQRVANRSPIDTLRLDSRRGEAAIPWNAASRWRTSGGRRTTSASMRASGVDSSDTARRWRSRAARATQPPRPNRSTTTSPCPVCCSIRAATTAGGGAGARRSKTGSE